MAAISTTTTRMTNVLGISFTVPSKSEPLSIHQVAIFCLLIRRRNSASRAFHRTYAIGGVQLGIVTKSWEFMSFVSIARLHPVRERREPC